MIPYLATPVQRRPVGIPGHERHFLLLCPLLKKGHSRQMRCLSCETNLRVQLDNSCIIHYNGIWNLQRLRRV